MFKNTEAAIIEVEALRQKRLERLSNAYSEANSNVSPNMDSNGRFHSPCDGYMISSSLEFRKNYDDVLFGKGEFLPIPLDYEDLYFGTIDQESSYGFQRRVKATIESINKLPEIIDGRVDVTVKHGKSWDQNGTQVAYAYINGKQKSVVLAIENDLMDALKDSVTPEEEVYFPENGRMTVTGEIVSFSFKDCPYKGVSVKMFVKTEQGHKLYGSMPSKVSTDDAGKKITFTGTMERGNNGITFFKRPTKVEVS